jgi:hypothetical protein
MDRRFSTLAILLVTLAACRPPRPMAQDTGRALPPADSTVATTPSTPPLDTTRAPGGPLAFVQFADSLTEGDLAWLRAEGFTIERVMEASHAVTVRVPPDYAKDPRRNPRVVQFSVQMR